MAITENVKNRIEAIRKNFPTQQALLIPMLHFIQEEKGWISEDSMKEAAEFLALPLSKVKEVASFYTMFNLKPVGKVHLQICTNISCWLNGSEKLLHCLEKRLSVSCGQTTTDGRYTLSEVECLASCGTAPVLQVNEDYYEQLDEKSLMKLMDQLDDGIKNQQKNIGRSSLNLEQGGH